ncbi:MAG: amino acid adenylation domain-containing protein, partial [Gemmatimonadetes bacterium]|nr:amino acid adenylation domain-containing protein [Gemmatimonadota bacterium]
IRARLEPGLTFRGLLAQVREHTLGAFAHQHLPFDKLVEELGVERTLAHGPLVQVMFSLQNNERPDVELGTAALEPISTGIPAAKFDLSLSVGDGSEAVGGNLAYRTDLFDAATAERIRDHYVRLLDAVAADPDRPLADYDVLGEDERRAMLETWNATDAPAPELRIHERFARQAVETPDAVAVEFGDERLSYAEVEARANRLARHLRARGVATDARVGLLLERSAETVVAVLGILKAGGAYVALDAGLPDDRIRFILDDAGAAAVVTRGALAARVAAFAGAVVRLDADAEAIASESSGAPAVEVSPRNLAYVIYTSGSTGTPKGVLVEHRGVENYLAWFDREVMDDEGFVLPVVSRLSFDAHVRQLYPPLLRGRPVRMLPEETAGDPRALLEELARHERVSFGGVPSLWAAMLELVRDGAVEPPPGLKVLLLGAEALPAELVEKTRALFPDVVIRNHYGPTETTVNISVARIDRAVTIGRPVDNMRVYLLDRALRPVPLGVPGELYASGAGVARGYLGRPALTAASFVPDPFSGVPGARMYRTGDRVRWREGGVLDYVGRVDQQVKVRGFRIEPGEIEAVLERHPGVRAAVVVPREDEPGFVRLVGYVMAEEGDVPPSATLKAWLGERLPEYMIPAAVVRMDAFPLTAGGKVDRRALPAPEAAEEEAEAFVAPRTQTEEILAGIFAEVLGVDEIPADVSFFDLGGHSLLAARLISRIRLALKAEVRLRMLFETPSVRALGARVDGMRRGGAAPAPPVVPVERGGPLPLSFAQQRLWFLDQLQPGSAAYNVAHALRLRGRLDVRALERSVAALVRRHEVLRTRFPSVDGNAVQVVEPAGPIAIRRVDLSEMEAAEREAELRSLAAAEARAPFDLAAGPLFRCTLLRLGEREHAVLFTLHHIVSDGWSTAVVVREVSELYAAYSEGMQPHLPELPVQYADFAAWQRGWLDGEVLEEQLAYWRGALAGAPPLLEVPTDRPRPLVQGERGGYVAFSVGEETAQRLRAFTRREGGTLFMSLLAAWQLLLSKYAGQDDVSVGTPIAGRTRIETEGLIGFFVNTLVLRTDLSGDPTFAALLRRVREVTLSAHQHQDIPFERLVEELAP